MTNGLRSLPRPLNADGNAVFSTCQQLAGAVGTSVVSTIVASTQQMMPTDATAGTLLGTQHAFALLLVLTLIMTIFAYQAVHKK